MRWEFINFIFELSPLSLCLTFIHFHSITFAKNNDIHAFRQFLFSNVYKIGSFDKWERNYQVGKTM